MWWQKLLLKVLNPRWIVNDEGEFGIRILGMTLTYYKYSNPLLNEERTFRVIKKQEFGEVIRNWEK